MISNLVKLTSTFTSRATAAGGVSYLNNCHQSPEFQSLVEHVRNIQPESLGFKPSNFSHFFRKNRITYFKVFENSNFSIGVFCLSQGCSLSLHDHPNMLVLTKVFFGKMHCRAMDLLDTSVQMTYPARLYQKEDYSVLGKELDAVLYQDKILEKDEVAWLTPGQGNVHSFTAVENCAILDVLTPGYDQMKHYCNFYQEVDANDQKSKISSVINLFKKGQDGENATEERKLVKLQYSLPPMDMDIMETVPYQGEALRNE